MNHPNPSEWVAYVYGEAAPETRRQLRDHLRDCAECRDQLACWEGSLDRLDAWRLPKASRPVWFAFEGLRWALAAATAVFLVGAGVALGRLTSPGSDAAAVRAVIEPEIRQQLRLEFATLLRDELAKTAAETLLVSDQQSKNLLADYALAWENQRAEDRRAVVNAMDSLAARHLAEWAALKKDVDTLAVNADAGLRRTELRLVHLADGGLPRRGVPEINPSQN